MPNRTPICVFLDKASIDCDDLDFSAIESLTNFTGFDRSSDEQVITHAEHAEIIITNKVKLGRAHFARLPQLKLICVIATGTNNIDFEAAAEYGVQVQNVKDYAAASVSQHVFWLILSLAGNFLPYQQDIKQGRWQQQDQFCLLTHPIQALQGKTLGLVGYGHIAHAVERIALAFGMKVIIAQSLSARREQVGTDERLPLDVVLSQSDFISLHCPLTEQTRNLISARELGLMKSSACIINTARGGIIHEANLLTALKSAQIGGAGLDCLEQEPPTADNQLITADLPQLIITPHNAWGAHQARQKLVDGTAENIQNYRASAT